MKVRYTAPAKRDLFEIGAWISADSKRAARAVTGGLAKHCMSLGRWPERYPIFAFRNERSIRRSVSGNYLVFYAVGENEVLILHILHAARDPEAAGLSDP